MTISDNCLKKMSNNRDCRSDENVLTVTAKAVARAEHVVALVGAGLSVESGIPTFRGPGGLWTKLGEPAMNGYDDFVRNPAEWWRKNLDQQSEPERTKFREAIDNAEPNPGHFALAQLEAIGVLKHQINQNVDNLHFRAGSSSVSEIHGNRTKLRCINCETRWHRNSFPGGDITLSSLEHILGKFPACPNCGGPVKSDTVMFGEPIPKGVLAECFQHASQSDCMLVIGTSATVYPAAGFPEEVKASGGFVVEANPNETSLSKIATHILRGPTGVTLPALVSKVAEIIGGSG